MCARGDQCKGGKHPVRGMVIAGSDRRISKKNLPGSETTGEKLCGAKLR